MFTHTIRRQLAAYALAMTAGVAAVHGIIVAADNHITRVGQLALAVVAIGYFAFYNTQYKRFRRVRYAQFASHLIGYLIVNGSYWLHAVYLWGNGQGSVIDSDWYGLLFGMSAFWGLGLAVHAWATFNGRGFEDAVVA